MIGKGSEGKGCEWNGRDEQEEIGERGGDAGEGEEMGKEGKEGSRREPSHTCVFFTN